MLGSVALAQLVFLRGYGLLDLKQSINQSISSGDVKFLQKIVIWDNDKNMQINDIHLEKDKEIGLVSFVKGKRILATVTAFQVLRAALMKPDGMHIATNVTTYLPALRRGTIQKRPV